MGVGEIETEEGAKLRAKATVKKHEEYNGVKQTIEPSWSSIRFLRRKLHNSGAGLVDSESRGIEMKFLIWAVIGFALMVLSVPYEFYQESYQYSDGSAVAGLMFLLGLLIVFMTFCAFAKSLLKGLREGDRSIW